MTQDEINLEINPALARKIITGFIRSETTRVGFDRAVIGLSGGVDSALACTLTAEALGELEASCDAPVPPLTLELEGLRSADEAGLALLRRLAAEGARLVGVSTYMALKLKLNPRTEE